MSMIDISNLTFAYEGSYDNIFENVTFRIDTDWKLGFTGRNGRGKTTFFNLLLGKYEYSGKITSSVAFEYFPYEVHNKTLFTYEVLQTICPQSEEWEILRELSLLQISPDILYQTFDTLSNGEQTKVLLAALFLNENSFLLIDEPTNHLDTAARKSVADYLNSKKGFILISHDRLFLDSCVDHILALNKTYIDIQSGNFSSWYYNKTLIDNYETAQNDKLKKDISRLTQAARRTSGWSDQIEKTKFGSNEDSKPDRGFIGHKSAKMMKRAKHTESRYQQASDAKSKLLHNIEAQESLKLYPLTYRNDSLLNLSQVTIFYDNKAICRPVTFTIHNGERIALTGKNGCGKSSILKLICEQDIAYTGELNKSRDLIISYVPQDTSFLKGSLKEYATSAGIDETLFYTILKKLDFNRAQFDKDISNFSGGQQKKVLIAGSLCQKAHLYIWDEPLNFIDIFSRIQIESLILEFKPTLLFVEHDSAFCSNVVTKEIALS